MRENGVGWEDPYRLSLGIEAERVNKVTKALKTKNFTLRLAPTFFHGKTCLEFMKLFIILLLILL